MKTVVVTGATSGIGLEVARILMLRGFNVIGVGHSKINCDRAEESLRSTRSEADITYFSADLMQQSEITRVARELREHIESQCEGRLHALINNAGCARNWYMTTDEGYEQQFALNYLAGFLLTHELLPQLQSAGGKVIMTGSKSHKGVKVHWDDVMLRHSYNPLTAYKQSKLCCILFAKGLNERCAAQGVRAYAVDPGLVKTDIGSKPGGIVSLVWKFRKLQGVSAGVPAQTYAFLCEQSSKPQALYYYLCKERAYSKQVTSENVDRLFALSEQLCGISYDKEEKT